MLSVHFCFCTLSCRKTQRTIVLSPHIPRRTGKLGVIPNDSVRGNASITLPTNCLCRGRFCRARSKSGSSLLRPHTQHLTDIIQCKRRKLQVQKLSAETSTPPTTSLHLTSGSVIHVEPHRPRLSTLHPDLFFILNQGSVISYCSCS